MAGAATSLLVRAVGDVQTVLNEAGLCRLSYANVKAVGKDHQRCKLYVVDVLRIWERTG